MTTTLLGLLSISFFFFFFFVCLFLLLLPFPPGCTTSSYPFLSSRLLSLNLSLHLSVSYHHHVVLELGPQGDLELMQSPTGKHVVLFRLGNETTKKSGCCLVVLWGRGELLP